MRDAYPLTIFDLGWLALESACNHMHRLTLFIVEQAKNYYQYKLYLMSCGVKNKNCLVLLQTASFIKSSILFLRLSISYKKMTEDRG